MGSESGRGTSRERLSSGMLRATCSACGFTYTAPDKGMGRANLAAWESRHGANCKQMTPARVQP